MYEIVTYLGQQNRLYGKANNHNMLGILSTLSLKKIRTMNTMRRLLGESDPCLSWGFSFPICKMMVILTVA